MPWISILRGTAGLFALLVAWTHLLHPRLGFSRFLLYLEVGTLYDPRPPLFILVSVAIMVGLVLGVLGIRRRALYAGGIVVTLALIVGYVAWHTVLSHGAFWPHIEAHAHHDVGIMENIAQHLLNDRIALVSKLAEVGTLVLLVVLLLVDRGDHT